MEHAFQTIANFVIIGLVMVGLMSMYDIFTRPNSGMDDDSDDGAKDKR